jgi:phage repressor protein C with HTH and peptisase S24 domain
MGAERKKPLTYEQAAACRRLRKLWDARRRELQLTQDKAAEAVGVTQGAIGNQLNGRLAVSLRALSKWSKLLRVNPSEIDPVLAKQLVIADDTREAEWVDITARKQAVALGHGAEVDEWAETRKLKFRIDSLRKKGLFPGKLEIYYGAGDSMEPRIRDGDALLYDTGDTRPIHGKIYILRWRGGLMAKRLRIYDGRLWISSDNKSDPQWKDDVPADPEKEDFEIVGRVRWIAGWED